MPIRRWQRPKKVSVEIQLEAREAIPRILGLTGPRLVAIVTLEDFLDPVPRYRDLSLEEHLPHGNRHMSLNI